MAWKGHPSPSRVDILASGLWGEFEQFGTGTCKKEEEEVNNS